MAREHVGMEAISEEEADRLAVVEFARKDHRIHEGELEIDGDAVVSHGGDNGAYVQAWIWIDFAGTPFDKVPEDADDVASGR